MNTARLGFWAIGLICGLMVAMLIVTFTDGPKPNRDVICTMETQDHIWRWYGRKSDKLQCYVEDQMRAEFFISSEWKPKQ